MSMEQLIPEERQLVEMAGERDRMMNEALEGGAPDGEYGVKALNGLVSALNKLLPMFAVDQDYPTFDESIDGPLPAAFIRQLSMVAQAANDAGVLEEDLDLDDVVDDQGLRMMAGKLETLSKNLEFKQFLKEEPAPSEAPVEEVTEEVPMEPMPEMDMDALMMDRL